MRNLFITICPMDTVAYLPEGIKTELFMAPLYEHTYRKIMDASNKLGLDVKFIRAATMELPGAVNEINASLEDIVVFASPLAFLAKGADIEGALEFVVKNDMGYATVGSQRGLYLTAGLGKMIVGASIGTCADFIKTVAGCGAKCELSAYCDGEKAIPSTRAEYLKRVSAYRDEFFFYLLQSGVEIDLTDGIIIAPNTEIHKRVKIDTGCHISQWSIINENVTLGHNTIIVNSEIAQGCKIDSSVITGATLEKDVTVGPFCTIKKGTHLLSGASLGSFCDIEDTKVGAETKINSLCRLSHAEIGARCIVGDNVVTVDFNDKRDTRCKIGDDVIIGSNTSLISPITIGSTSFIAAGSTITDNVPAGSLAIAREYQSNHEGWAKRKKRSKL